MKNLEKLSQTIKNPSAMIVYYYLVSTSFNPDNHSGKVAYQSHAEIARALGFSKSTSQKSIKLLNELRLIRTVQEKPSLVPCHKILRHKFRPF